MRKSVQQFVKDIYVELNSGEPLLVGKALTKAFGISVFLLAILPQHSLDGGWQIRVWAFVLSPPNEIGDTFAGLAGVLAFLWIIVTVWLQSQALNEQRDELKLTRKEFEAQRIATQDMARAMAAQAAIFELEQSDRLRAGVDSEMASLLDETSAHIERKIHFCFEWHINGAHGAKPWEGDSSANLVAFSKKEGELDAKLYNQVSSLVDSSGEVIKGLDAEVFVEFPKNIEDLERLASLLNMLEDKNSEASPSMQARLRKLEILSLNQPIRDIIAKTNALKKGLVK